MRVMCCCRKPPDITVSSRSGTKPARSGVWGWLSGSKGSAARVTVADIGSFPHGYSESDLADLQAEFCRLDEDGSRQVSVAELVSKLGISPLAAAWLLKQHDLDGDGQLSFAEYVRFKRQLQVHSSTPAAERKAALRVMADEVFVQYAVGNKLQQRDMRKLFEVRFGATLPAEEFQRLFERFDTNNDGSIDRDELRRLFELIAKDYGG